MPMELVSLVPILSLSGMYFFSSMQMSRGYELIVDYIRHDRWGYCDLWLGW